MDRDIVNRTDDEIAAYVRETAALTEQLGEPADRVDIAGQPAPGDRHRNHTATTLRFTRVRPGRDGSQPPHTGGRGRGRDSGARSAARPGLRPPGPSHLPRVTESPRCPWTSSPAPGSGRGRGAVPLDFAVRLRQFSPWSGGPPTEAGDLFEGSTRPTRITRPRWPRLPRDPPRAGGLGSPEVGALVFGTAEGRAWSSAACCRPTGRSGPTRPGSWSSRW